MKVKRYSAKHARDDHQVIGFYFQMPEYEVSPLDKPLKVAPTMHYIMSYNPGDWGMLNTPTLTEIDVKTLKEYDEVDINND